MWQHNAVDFILLVARTNLMVKIGQLQIICRHIHQGTKRLRQTVNGVLMHVDRFFYLHVHRDPSSVKSFRNSANVFIKVLASIIGDLDENLLKTGDKSTKISAYIMYAAFIIYVSITPMNLLVGIAVTDIQDLKKISRHSASKCQINIIGSIERLMFKSFWPQYINKNPSISSLPLKKIHLRINRLIE